MGNNTYYDLTCSVPPEGVHFVGSPRVRGTLDIAWSCLAVLLLSTWELSNQRNVPKLSVPPKTQWDSIKREMQWCLKRTGDTVVAVLIPEWVTLTAISRYRAARKGVHDAREFGKEDGISWCIKKSYFAALAGFCVRLENNLESHTHEPASERFLADERGDQNLADGGFAVNVHPTVPNSSAQKLPTRIKTSGQLLYLRRIGVLEILPQISIDELNDKNKSNTLLQALALAQTSWLLVSVIVRYIERLVVTQVEIVTLAFAILNLITRAIDWYRPKDVHVPIVLQPARQPTEKELEKFHQMPAEDDSGAAFAVGLSVGILFGGLHCLAWHDKFPTQMELVLWRTAAVITTCAPPVIVSLSLGIDSAVGYVVFTFALFVYALSRLFIIVETIRSLFYQPSNAFIGTWAVNFPHLG